MEFAMKFIFIALLPLIMANQVNAKTYRYDIVSTVTNQNIPDNFPYDWPETFDVLNSFTLDTSLIESADLPSWSLLELFRQSNLELAHVYLGGKFYLISDKWSDLLSWNRDDQIGDPHQALLTIDREFNLVDWAIVSEWPYMTFSPRGGEITDFWYNQTVQTAEEADNSWWIQTSYTLTRTVIPADVAPVPLPAAAISLLIGLMGLGLVGMRKQSQRVFGRPAKLS